ncbi:MAG: TRAP transporter small permease [Rubrivivax sp.]
MKPSESRAEDDFQSAFHVEDTQVDLSGYGLESWISVVFFWLLGATVFHQFFTRYVLNDSAAWTEEIARYLLIATVFVGMGIGVRKHNHIRVDFFFRFLPRAMTRPVALLTDVLNSAFYIACVVLTWLLMEKMGSYQMTIVDLPMNIVYGVCGVGFLLCAVRSLQVLWRHWRDGYAGVDDL